MNWSNNQTKHFDDKDDDDTDEDDTEKFPVEFLCFRRIAVLIPSLQGPENVPCDEPRAWQEKHHAPENERSPISAAYIATNSLFYKVRIMCMMPRDSARA